MYSVLSWWCIIFSFLWNKKTLKYVNVYVDDNKVVVSVIFVFSLSRSIIAYDIVSNNYDKRRNKNSGNVWGQETDERRIANIK